MNQEPQSPLWPEAEVKTIAKRAPESDAKAEPSRAESEPSSSSSRKSPDSFGERLQREREMRSITLDEIANSTKIGTRLLHALEAEELTSFPVESLTKDSYARTRVFLVWTKSRPSLIILPPKASKISSAARLPVRMRIATPASRNYSQSKAARALTMFTTSALARK